ncbi:TolB family protein [Sphaerisporangium corydalis]|uniref:TolB family protein n=1 Tax=Sphaerisporangium corydalis TaxID=1441875 RepID=A0ABV9EPU4_9ACTN|nr:hypothetical protein [Sphaerisporangium corydalis]
MKLHLSAGAAIVVALTLAPSVPAGADQAVTARRPLTGAAVYFEYKADAFGVDRYAPGTGFARVGRAPGNNQFSASPDGRKLAWITINGKLVVRAGGRTKAIATTPPGGPCATPAWSPDAKRVAFVGKGDVVTIVNADGTGRRAAGRTAGVCHLAWSGDGRYLAGYAGTADAVHRLDLTTGRAARAKGVKLVNHVQGLSRDGRRVIIHTVPRGGSLGDGAWPATFPPSIVDVVTGAKVPIPVTGRLIGACYLADGRLVVRVAGAVHNTLVVLDEAGKELQRLPEPAAARKRGLLRVLA